MWPTFLELVLLPHLLGLICDHVDPYWLHDCIFVTVMYLFLDLFLPEQILFDFLLASRKVVEWFVIDASELANLSRVQRHGSHQILLLLLHLRFAVHRACLIDGVVNFNTSWLHLEAKAVKWRHKISLRCLNLLPSGTILAYYLGCTTAPNLRHATLIACRP